MFLIPLWYFYNTGYRLINYLKMETMGVKTSTFCVDLEPTFLSRVLQSVEEEKGKN